MNEKAQVYPELSIHVHGQRKAKEINIPFPQKLEVCQILFQVATFLKRGTSRPLGRGNHLGFSPLPSSLVQMPLYSPVGQW